MANKEKIDHLLLDIRELEKLIAGMRDAEVYPVSFFSQTFDLTHKLLTDLHVLESEQIESLRRQMEERRQLIQTIPSHQAAPHPEPEESDLLEELEELVDEPALAVEEPLIIEPVKKQEEKKNSPVIEKPPVFLNEILEKRNLSDFRKAFSLNDRFYFRRELFSGDEARMNKVIVDLNDIHSYEKSIDYLNEKLNWNMEDPTVADFIKLLEKRFM